MEIESEKHLIKKGALLLLPNLIAEHQHHEIFLPQSVDKAVGTIDGLIAESEKAGRKFLSRFKTKKTSYEIPLALYNKKTPDADIDFYLEPIKKGERWGLISDSGLPCIADPGAKLVARAKQTGLLVQAFVGPSSIVLALMQSGLYSQSFAFHSYLDKNSENFQKDLRQLEIESKKARVTQIFMERPYRNRQALEIILNTLQGDTQLCIAAELTGKEQMICTQTVDNWKKSPLPSIDKKNTLFLFLSARDSSR